MWLKDEEDAKTSKHSSSPLVGMQFSLPAEMKPQQSEIGTAYV